MANGLETRKRVHDRIRPNRQRRQPVLSLGIRNIADFPGLKRRAVRRDRDAWQDGAALIFHLPLNLSGLLGRRQIREQKHDEINYQLSENVVRHLKHTKKSKPSRSPQK